MNRLDHIGIFVRNIEAASAIYARYGVQVERIAEFQVGEGRTIRVAFLPLQEGLDLEMIEAPAALDNGMEPLNHLCFEVPDIHAELAALKAAGVPLENEEPRPGVAAPLIAFLDRAAADGVRIEIAQK